MSAGADVNAGSSSRTETKVTSASELRDVLRQIELGIAGLKRGTTEDAVAVVRRMHVVEQALPELESRFKVDLKAERTRLKTIEGALRSNAPLLVSKAGAGRLRSLRQELGATGDDWWLHLDTAVAADRTAKVRKLAIRVGAVVAVIALLAVIYQLFLAPKVTDDLSDRLRQAQEHLNQGQLETALGEYQSILAEDAGGMEAPLAIGAILTQLGRASEAQSYLDRAQVAAPSEADYYAELAQVYYNMAAQGGLDTTSAAEEAAQAALQADPDSANAYLALGGVYELRGQVTEAVTALQKASALSTDAALTAAIQMRLAMLSQKPVGLPTVSATGTGQ